MNYFIEGIQGSGKTTMLEKMTQDNPKLKAYREGDFSPVELAWCAYVSHSQYEIIIKKYANLAGEIKKNTVKEGEMYIITYTRIITDIPDFHKELEQYEMQMKPELFIRVMLKNLPQVRKKSRNCSVAFFLNWQRFSRR